MPRQGRTLFEGTMITESANHKRYRVSLRSSSKRVPSNPSPNGVSVSGFKHPGRERAEPLSSGSPIPRQGQGLPPDPLALRFPPGGGRLGIGYSVSPRRGRPQVHQYGLRFFSQERRFGATLGACYLVRQRERSQASSAAPVMSRG